MRHHARRSSGSSFFVANGANYDVVGVDLRIPAPITTARSSTSPSALPASSRTSPISSLDARAFAWARRASSFAGLRFLLAVTVASILAAPAAAQRYTAKQDGDVIELADATAQMNVSVVWSMSNAWRIQVKGKDLVRTVGDAGRLPGPARA